jgi:hypothetical protein
MSAALLDSLIPTRVWHWVDELAPVVYLHSDESYFPCAFREYIARCQLKNARTGRVFQPDARFNADVLGDWVERFPDQVNDGQHTLVVQRGLEDPFLTQRPADLRDVPLYAHVLKAGAYEFYLTYVHMYAYNGRLPVLGGLFHAGAHFADMEHVTMHVRFDTGTFSDAPTLLRVYYSRHSGGVWINAADDTTTTRVRSAANHRRLSFPLLHCRDGCDDDDDAVLVDIHPATASTASDAATDAAATTTTTATGGGDDALEFDAATGRLCVYSARHSHASYNCAGRKARFLNACPDVCDRGHRWQSRRVVHLNADAGPNHALPAHLRWTRFRGTLGDGHVDNFPNKDFMAHVDVAKNYKQGLCFWWT